MFFSSKQADRKEMPIERLSLLALEPIIKTIFHVEQIVTARIGR